MELVILEEGRVIHGAFEEENGSCPKCLLEMIANNLAYLK